VDTTVGISGRDDGVVAEEGLGLLDEFWEDEEVEDTGDEEAVYCHAGYSGADSCELRFEAG
jgi:hypothetical protein